jgi:hypothetical protein
LLLPPTRRSPVRAIEALNQREVGRRGDGSFRRCARARDGRLLGAARHLAERVEEQRRIDRLGDVAAHAVGEAKVAFFQRGMCRHRVDRQRRETLIGTDLRGRLVSVHLGHLQVHEHHVIGGRYRPAE